MIVSRSGLEPVFRDDRASPYLPSTNLSGLPGNGCGRSPAHRRPRPEDGKARSSSSVAAITMFPLSSTRLSSTKSSRGVTAQSVTPRACSEGARRRVARLVGRQGCQGLLVQAIDGRLVRPGHQVAVDIHGQLDRMVPELVLRSRTPHTRTPARSPRMSGPTPTGGPTRPR